MSNRILFGTIAAFACFVGLYPLAYLFMDSKFGLLATKPEDLLQNIRWNTAFYLHILLGGVALITGWPQFVDKWRIKYPVLHRSLGKTYVACCMVSGLSAIYISLNATGGLIPAAGFFNLAFVWLFTTYTAYKKAVARRFNSHRKWMIFSYAACLAAVMLRIYLPLLVWLTGDFETAYPIVAWLCWVPNILVAYILVNRKQKSVPVLQ